MTEEEVKIALAKMSKIMPPEKIAEAQKAIFGLRSLRAAQLDKRDAQMRKEGQRFAREKRWHAVGIAIGTIWSFCILGGVIAVLHWWLFG